MLPKEKIEEIKDATLKIIGDTDSLLRSSLMRKKHIREHLNIEEDITLKNYLSKKEFIIVIQKAIQKIVEGCHKN